MGMLYGPDGKPISSTNPLPVALTASNVQQTPGSAVATKDVMLLGASDGTNAQGLKVDAQKNLLVGIRDSGGNAPGIAYANADALSELFYKLYTASFGFGFNNATWDHWRNNTEGPLLVSAARTASTPTPNQTNYNASALIITLSITAAPAGETLNVEFKPVDPVSGGATWAPALLTTDAGGTGLYRLMIGLGVKDGALGSHNKGVPIPVPRTWTAQVYPTTAGQSFTYSLGYQYMVN